MGSYLNYFGEWLSGIAGKVGEWSTRAAYNVTHDPLWGGVAAALVLGFVLLIYLKRRASG
ncbi:MAG: hypothetical protein K2R98_16255 [Gemmataceae bacterium]|nr:hypothetical protein [Gemmataceae bacterium]